MAAFLNDLDNATGMITNVYDELTAIKGCETDSNIESLMVKYDSDVKLMKENLAVQRERQAIS